ncbi:MAG: 1-deoxy-D-xylulose-5-phosphate synthase, partial [Clostridia bacterium]|nr:1-deoxy-D-xylulose-5-phosphate synthase [Clostridia bacterium]
MTDYPVLESIESPSRLKELSDSELAQLCDEIRDKIISTVSKNGGHLASNLGVVELTVALLMTFDPPEDSIVYDVGHQAYVYKLLTGRYGDFESLRRDGGISGFPKRQESLYDAFNTGHASTSISAALGILRAKRRSNAPGSAVALIGDGSLTGGMAFEALDDAGRSKLPLIVILNDNSMSIERNVGAISSHLSNIRLSRGYQRIKRNAVRGLKKTKLGKSMYSGIERMKNRIKYFLQPNNILFEALGFTYIGPIDGHDIDAIVSVIRRAKALDKPVLIHAITKKGFGYLHAEEKPDEFHGIAAFDISTGECTASAANNSKVFGHKLCELAAEDERICAITAAMTAGTGLTEFSTRFADRFYDVGIAEQHAVTLAAGMAVGGMKPVVAIYSTFLQRAYDQILHDVCLQGLPVVFAVDRAGLVGEDGETHQGVYDIAYMRTIPDLTLYSPATVRELEEMLEYALRRSEPSAIRYNRGLLASLQDSGGAIERGKWAVIREPREITLIASGRMLARALQVAGEFDVGVINARFLKPID